MNPADCNNLFESFAALSEKYPGKTAVYFLGTRYSYARLRDLAERFAAGLSGLGLRTGDRLLMYIPNSIQFVVSWLGLQRLGCIPVPITPIYTTRDVNYILKDTDAKAVICSDRNYGYVKQAMEGTSVAKVIVTNIADLLPAWKKFFGVLADRIPRGTFEKADFVYQFKSLITKGQSPLPPVSTGRSDVAEFLFTGGTTKHPKGVPITHGLFLVSATEQLAVRIPLFESQQDVILGGAPLFHILGQTCSLATVLVGGGTLILLPKVNLDAVFDSIETMKASSLIGVPAFYRMILEHDRLDQYDLSSLRYCFCAGDVLPEEVANRWKDRFGLSIYQGYGATETCGGIVLSPTDKPSPTMSMGLPLPSKSIMIVKPDSLEPVNDEQPGELLVSSKEMVTAYLNKPEETDKAFVEINGRLWYRTADIVRRDKNGFLYFVDRTVDTIKHKGYRISASEIEAVLQEHPAVIESCVVGVPDAQVGERIKAFVVLKKDIKGVTGYELIKWCRKRLVNYKIPQYIEFRDMLPKSKVGKLLRREIRSEEKKRLET